MRDWRLVTERMGKTRISSKELQIISDPGQSDGGVLDALGNLVRAIRGTTDGQCSTASG